MLPQSGTDLDAIIRAAAEERASLLRLLAQLQASTTNLPPSNPLYHGALSTAKYGYGEGLASGYSGINAHLLSRR